FKQLKNVILSDFHGIRAEKEIEFVRFNNNHIYLKFTGIDTKEDASKYKGFRVQIPEEQIFPLPEGVYYQFQLLGLRVCDEEKGYLGMLRNIIETGANDVYVIDSENYGEILIPAIKQVVRNIDLEENVMQIRLLPGLVDFDSK
ncbi:MAG: ribosome maturation factor RimM, partial [Syntrophomonadaceae bacterium]|nr:ribosome maturation factor RimM [Syntrophomonadaceae bacterium]